MTCSTNVPDFRSFRAFLGHTDIVYGSVDFSIIIP
jgi:hypothetical protein